MYHARAQPSWSAKGLVLCFRPSLRAQVICSFRLETTRFAFSALFFWCFEGKISVTTTIMQCMDDTLKEEDGLMIFDELKVQKLDL